MFFIVEQGSRIHTPIDSLLQAREVSELSASNPIRRVGPGVEDQQRAKIDAKALTYQKGDDDSPRQAVVYAHEIMTSPVVTAPLDQTLDQTWRLFSKRGFHHLPLLDDKQQLQGIVSDRDLLRFAANNNREVGSYRIEQLMARSVISAAAEAEIRAIAEVMCRRAISAIPVVSERLEVLGIVTRSDILRALVHRAPLELWA